MAKVFSPAAQAEIELTPGDAQASLLRGETAATGKQLVTKGDQVLEIDASKLAEAFDLGWQLSDTETADKVILRREESDASSTALGLVEAGLRGVSLGTSDTALSAFGADGERMQARRDATGNFGTAVEIGAALAPGLLTGGTGAAAGVARSLGARALAATPAALAVRAGAGVGRAVAGTLPAGAGLAARTARAVLPTAAGEAVEGYFFGAGNELTEAALGEREINAEKMLMEDGLMGAALGGALGAAMPGVTKLAAGASKLPAAATKRIMDSLPSGGPGVFSDGIIDPLARGAARISGGNPDDFVKAAGYLKTPESRRIAHEAINNYDAVLERTTREVVDDVSSANTTLAQAMEIATGANKIGRVEKLLPAEADLVAPRVSLEALRQADNMLAAVEAKALKRGGYVLNDLEDARARIATAVAEATEKPGAASSFRAMNRLKQDLDLVTRRRKGQLTHEVQDTITEIQNATGGIRKHLERTDLWGGAGTLQAETNLAYAQMMRSTQELGSRTSVLGRMLDPSTPVAPSDALALVKQYGKIAGEAKFAKIDKALDDRLAYIDSVRRNYELSAEQGASFDAAAAAVAKMRKSLASKVESAEVLEVLGKVRRAEGADSPSLNAISSVGSLFGLTVGGAPGLLIGRAVTSPYTTLRTLIGLGHMADKAGIKIDGAVGRALGRMRPAAKLSDGSTARRSTGGGSVAASGVLAATSDDDETPKRADTLKLIERVTRLAQHPNTLVDETELPFFDARNAAPRLVSSMQDHIMNSAVFLASKAPAVYRPPYSSAPPMFDEAKMASFERYAAVVKNPKICFDKLASGMLTTEHAEALRVCWPKIYSYLQDKIVQELADAQAANRDVPFDMRINVGTLFQVVTDVSLQPLVYAAIQAVHAGTVLAAADQQTQSASTRDVKMNAPSSVTERMQQKPGEVGV